MWKRKKERRRGNTIQKKRGVKSERKIARERAKEREREIERESKRERSRGQC